MNFDLEKIVEKIAEDNELSQEFSRLDEMDDIYNYCKDMGLDCDEKEFDNEISGYINALNEEDMDYYGKSISDEELSNVGGGIDFKKMFSKSVAMMLSALTIGGSIGLGSAGATGSSKVLNNSNISLSQKISNKWSETKKAVSEFYNKHKKPLKIGAAVTVGVLVLAGAATAASVKYKKANSEKKAKTETDKQDQAKTGEQNKIESGQQDKTKVDGQAKDEAKKQTKTETDKQDEIDSVEEAKDETKEQNKTEKDKQPEAASREQAKGEAGEQVKTEKDKQAETDSVEEAKDKTKEQTKTETDKQDETASGEKAEGETKEQVKTEKDKQDEIASGEKAESETKEQDKTEDNDKSSELSSSVLGQSLVEKSASERLKVPRKPKRPGVRVPSASQYIKDFDSLRDEWYKDPSEKNLQAIKDFVDKSDKDVIKTKYQSLLAENASLQEVMKNPTDENWYELSNREDCSEKFRIRAKVMGDIEKLRKNYGVGEWVKSMFSWSSLYNETAKSVDEAEELGIKGVREAFDAVTKWQ